MASLAEAAQILLGMKTNFDQQVGEPFKKNAAAILAKFRQDLLATQGQNDLAKLDEACNAANERYQQAWDQLINSSRSQCDSWNQKLDEYSNQGNPDDPSVTTYIREFVGNYEDIARRKHDAVFNSALAKELTPNELHPFTAYEIKYNFRGEKSLIVH